jgi:hypothetical protein
VADKVSARSVGTSAAAKLLWLLAGVADLHRQRVLQICVKCFGLASASAGNGLSRQIAQGPKLSFLTVHESSSKSWQSRSHCSLQGLKFSLKFSQGPVQQRSITLSHCMRRRLQASTGCAVTAAHCSRIAGVVRALTTPDRLVLSHSVASSCDRAKQTRS